MKIVKVLVFFLFINSSLFSQNSDSLLINYNKVLYKSALVFVDSLIHLKSTKGILAIKIVEMDTNVQKFSFAITSFIKNNEFNYLNPSFYFKVNNQLVLVKKNENGDLMQKKLKLPKVDEEIIKEVERNIIVKSADNWIHEPESCQYFFSNDTIKSIFYYRLPLPWEYQILY